MLIADVVWGAPKATPIRTSTTQSEVQTERLRVIQRVVRLAWNEASPPTPGRAIVALRVGEDGRIHEYAIQRLAGDAAFERFLVGFVRSLLVLHTVAGPGEALWVECEFVVEPSR